MIDVLNLTNKQIRNSLEFTFSGRSQKNLIICLESLVEAPGHMQPSPLSNACIFRVVLVGFLYRFTEILVESLNKYFYYFMLLLSYSG